MKSVKESYQTGVPERAPDKDIREACKRRKSTKGIKKGHLTRKSAKGIKQRHQKGHHIRALDKRTK